MKKSITLGGSILCLFILVSLSYQPIVADMPIETIPMAKKSKASNLDVDELKELFNKLIEIKSQSDCNCYNPTTRWGFPIICSVLGLFTLISLFLCISLDVGCDLSLLLYNIGHNLCDWV